AFATFLNKLAPAGSQQQADLLTWFEGWSWDQILHFLVNIMPAASGTSWQIMLVANALLAQTVLRISTRAIRPCFDLADLSLPRSLAGIFAGALIIAFAGGQVGFLAGTVAALVFVPYFFLGLSVVHAIPARGAGRTIMLALFYFPIFVQGWV